MLLSNTFSFQLNLNKVLSKFFVPRVLKRSSALSWNDKQLACLNDKPDPRLFLAKKAPYNWSPSYCKYSLIPCFTSPLWADSSESYKTCLCWRQKDGAVLLQSATGGLLRFFWSEDKQQSEGERVWEHILICKVCQNNNYSFFLHEKHVNSYMLHTYFCY